MSQDINTSAGHTCHLCLKELIYPGEHIIGLLYIVLSPTNLLCDLRKATELVLALAFKLMFMFRGSSEYVICKGV